MSTEHPLSAPAWLDAWERAAALPPGLREAELLSTACAAGRTELAGLPLGVRDRLLLDLRRALFGAQLQCTARCPACGERCEWACSVDALRAADDAGAAAGGQWTGDGWVVRFRPVNGLDLAALQGCDQPAAASRRLLERCVLAATRDAVPVPAAALPPDVAAALAAALAEADPQAAASVALECPACAQAWEADFDAGAFLWAELDAWARRALAEVHELALRYGWSERDVLALSPARRAHYLALGAA